MRFLVSSVVGFLVLIAVPGDVVAASLASFAGCNGPDCTTCNIVYTANGLIKWLIGFLFVIFMAMMAYAGYRLVVSNGNQGELDKAKDMLTNAVVGILIVLAAWLVVDTIMRGLVGEDGKEGMVRGAVSGWMLWSQVECYTITEVNKNVEAFDPGSFDPYEAPVWVGDPGSALFGAEVVYTNSCAATPAGNRNCTAAIASCQTSGGYPQVNTDNPDNHTVNCIKQTSNSGGSAIGTGSGSVGCGASGCVPLTIPCKNSRSCSVASDMVQRLARMHAAAAVSGARVTEAMPRTRDHKSRCHYDGTCVDYGRAGGLNAAEVSRIINAASKNGLRAVYEVQTQSQKDALVNGGAPAGNIKVLGDWISAPHFSIYGS